MTTRKDTALDRMKLHIETIDRELGLLIQYLDQEQNDVLKANWTDVGTVAEIARQLTETRKFWDNTTDQES